MQIPTFTRSQLVFSNLFLWEFIICWFFSNKSILQNNNWCFPLSKWFLLLKIKIEVANYINWKLGILFAVIWRKLGNEQIAEVTSSGKICPMANENHIGKWIIFHISSFAMIEKKSVLKPFILLRQNYENWFFVAISSFAIMEEINSNWSLAW